MEPITFNPIYMERAWGGRALQHQLGRSLPSPNAPFGESWEIVDRADAQSIVNHGPFAGQSLHDLWTTRRPELFGNGFPESDRFPMLIKVLDAHLDLSIQVHPPAAIAPSLNGEPKTEMWVVLHAEPKSQLYAGLKAGVSRDQFVTAIDDGTVAEVVHALSPVTGDSIFIPSGRLHAIGGGLLIYEVQQNSDTTYRVFDWNRVGLDGKPRELHVAASLASMDFNDFEPTLNPATAQRLADCPFFTTDRVQLDAGQPLLNPEHDAFSIIHLATGSLTSNQGRTFAVGDTLILPRGAPPLTAATTTTIIQSTLPRTS